MDMDKLQRVLRGYSKVDGNLVLELPVDEIELGILQQAFGVSAEDQMYECYPVDSEKLQSFQDYLHAEVDLHTLDFFLECDAIQ